jgi:hypothetical protein
MPRPIYADINPSPVLNPLILEIIYLFFQKYFQALPTIFSAGLDITEFMKDAGRLKQFWESFQNIWLKLYGSRLATVAAVNVSSLVCSQK